MTVFGFKLIPDWSLAWRFLSVQAAVLLALLSGLQAEVLPLVSPLFPDHIWPWVSGTLAMAVVVLRLVAQDGLQIPRSHLELDAFDAHADAYWPVGKSSQLSKPKRTTQAMPSGRLERYLGAVALLMLVVVIVLMVLAIWAVWSTFA